MRCIRWRVEEEIFRLYPRIREARVLELQILDRVRIRVMNVQLTDRCVPEAVRREEVMPSKFEIRLMCQEVCLARAGKRQSVALSVVDDGAGRAVSCMVLKHVGHARE